MVQFNVKEASRTKYKTFYPFYDKACSYVDDYGMGINDLHSYYYEQVKTIIKKGDEDTVGNMVYIIEILNEIGNKKEFRKILTSLINDFTDAFEKTQLTQKNKSKK